MGGSSLATLLILPPQTSLSEWWISIRPIARQSMLFTSVQVFWGVATATTSCGLEFLDFLPPTTATFYMAMPSACGVPLPDCQAASSLRDFASWLGPWWWHRTSSESYLGHCVAGDETPIMLGPKFRLHGAWYSWYTSCKFFLWRWWEMSERCERTGARCIRPRRHGTLW